MRIDSGARARRRPRRLSTDTIACACVGVYAALCALAWASPSRGPAAPAPRRSLLSPTLFNQSQPEAHDVDISLLAALTQLMTPEDGASSSSAGRASEATADAPSRGTSSELILVLVILEVPAPA